LTPVGRFLWNNGGRWARARHWHHVHRAAIAESKPVQIHAQRSFCSKVQRWTCAAFRFHDPTDGELLGRGGYRVPAAPLIRRASLWLFSVGHHVESVFGAIGSATDHENLLCHFLARERCVERRYICLPSRRDPPRHRARSERSQIAQPGIDAMRNPAF